MLFIILVCFSLYGISKVKNRNLSESGHCNKYKCSIVTTKNNSKISFTGMFWNNKNEQVRIFYKLGAIKKGISGNSDNAQSGEVLVKRNTEVVLSNISFNLSKDDTYLIKLQIFKGNRIISSDSLDFDYSN